MTVEFEIKQFEKEIYHYESTDDMKVAPVEVLAMKRFDGVKVPKALNWEDGLVYRIDRVLKIQKAPSLKTGGCVWRYLCQVGRRQIKLLLEEDVWYLEGQ